MKTSKSKMIQTVIALLIMFVAGFIGSPQMNFIDCTIEKGKEGYGVNFAGKLIPLPQGKFPDKLMAEYAGKTVVLGAVRRTSIRKAHSWK